MRRGPWWKFGGGGVRATLIHLTRDGSRVSLRVVAGSEEVAVVEARVLKPAINGFCCSVGGLNGLGT